MKATVYALVGTFLAGVALMLSIAVVFGAQAGACAPGAVSRVETSGVPSAARPFVSIYLEAAARFELGRRGPAVLAAIHGIETGFSQNVAVSGAGAVGPMQFMPPTWDTYGVDADGDGVADPYDIEDAIHSAANYLRASGAPRDWRSAIFAYNHADWYVAQVLHDAARFAELDGAAGPICTPGGPAALDRAVRLSEPREFVQIPPEYMASGFTDGDQIDSRIYPDMIWILETYDLVVTAGRESGHRTHGDGTALDMAPRSGNAIADWDRTARRLAQDLGWTPGCAASGSEPACDLAPAIQFVGYNGFDANHGDPAHTSLPHIHVSWRSSSFGDLSACQCTGPPPDWVLAFPLAEGSS